VSNKLEPKLFLISRSFCYILAGIRITSGLGLWAVVELFSFVCTTWEEFPYFLASLLIFRRLSVNSIFNYSYACSVFLTFITGINLLLCPFYISFEASYFKFFDRVCIESFFFLNVFYFFFNLAFVLINFLYDFNCLYSDITLAFLYIGVSSS